MTHLRDELRDLLRQHLLHDACLPLGGAGWRSRTAKGTAAAHECGRMCWSGTSSGGSSGVSSSKRNAAAGAAGSSTDQSDAGRLQLRVPLPQLRGLLPAPANQRRRLAELRKWGGVASK